MVGQRVDAVKKERAQALRTQMTEEEGVLWQRLRANRLDGFHFRRQQIIDGFIVDFYCHAVGLVIEIDGAIHEQQVDYDAERDRILKARGLNVIRIPNAEIRENLDGVLQTISTDLRKKSTHR